MSGTDLYVTNNDTGVVGKYTTAGATQNASFITGVNGVSGITVSGTHLYVSSQGDQTVKDYSTSGTLLNGSLISTVNGPRQTAVSGSFIYVANNGNNTIGKYTTAGGTVNASLISGLSSVTGVAVSSDGSELFVATQGDGDIGAYNATTGAAINASLITGLTPEYLAVLGSNLYVADFGGKVAEYTTSGQVVNTSLVSGLNGPLALAVVPEPTSGLTIAAVAGLMALRRSRNKAR